ncbi:hypothetical protein C8F04DRAFT_1270451 [Mycena alexandri]|uniref:Uncharacterized protein n=1 Tax=Mycena alexandri TaxID=1745969 RepID=A0AAD6WUS9_9AGAR|nr:hypothetical protein C8F04DRAFT_1270451 [Mycena alexandri]
MSLVTFNCLAVLENPRVPDDKKPKSCIVDAQIFLNGSLPSLVACLRWYNAENFEFPDMIGTYSLWIQAANMTEAVEHFSTSLKTKDYQFAGDILDLIHLGPAEEIDPFHRAIVHVCGTVSKPNENDGIFEINAEQYISALKLPGAIRFKVVIPNIPRYSKKKPVPSANSRALITGHITDVEHLLDAEEKPRSVLHFVIEMNTVVFLGSVKGGTGETPVMKPAFKTEGGTPSQLKFSFAKQLQTPSPAERANKKRKREESTQSDKGEGSSKPKD